MSTTRSASGAVSPPAEPVFPPTMAVAGINLRIDLVTNEVVGALREAGVDSILLKGPALARLLYRSSPERPYSDIDLLVSPDDWTRAGEVLTSLGFVGGDPAPGIPHDRAPYGRDWSRLADASNIDLHEGLSETTGDRRVAWRYLWEHREAMDLRGEHVWVLDVPRRAMLIGLHAAHHRGSVTKTLEDLRRAITLLPETAWAEAADAARTLDCEVVFAAGLRMTEEGAELAGRLGLTDEPWLAGLVLDAGDYDASQAVALGFERLDEINGLNAKVVFAFRKLF
ncbi:MAG TPA: nucleotidyltransferase family protein, partial [Actinomycetota bacterium]